MRQRGHSIRKKNKSKFLYKPSNVLFFLISPRRKEKELSDFILQTNRFILLLIPIICHVDMP